MRLLIVVLIAALSLTAGCSGGPEKQARTLTQRQRDSTLAQTKLPGSATIKKSYALSDSARSRADRLEQLPR